MVIHTINGKVFLIISLVTLVLSLSTPAVMAHPASNVNLEYELDNQTLEVEIEHSVGEPEEHYIDVVEIRKNEELILSENYTSQPTNSAFTHKYDIDAAEGDTISVYTHCNKGGDLTGELEVGKKQTQNGGYTWLLIGGVIVAIIVIVGIVYARKR